MPMPVSQKGNSDPVTAVFLSLMSGDGDGAFLGELVGVAHQIQQGLPDTNLVGMDSADVHWAIDDEVVAVLRRHRLDGLDHVGNERRKREGLDLQLHSPGFDLG